MAIIIIVLIIFIAILVTNLRKSKLEEDILTQNNKQLRNLMNALPDIICFKDSDGKYISMNKTCKDVLELNSRSEEHTSELQSRQYLVCRLLLEKKKKQNTQL